MYISGIKTPKVNYAPDIMTTKNQLTHYETSDQ